jgi:hypothetical protein
MPTGPKGQKRPADVIGRIATGEMGQAPLQRRTSDRSATARQSLTDVSG